MLSMHSDEGYVLRALKAGAQRLPAEGFGREPTWPAPSAPPPKASRSSARPWARCCWKTTCASSSAPAAEDSYELLSPREREVLQLVAEGKSSKDIANLLNLSVYTVETHRARIMQKLNLHSVPELILYAVRKGVVS